MTTAPHFPDTGQGPAPLVTGAPVLERYESLRPALHRLGLTLLRCALGLVYLWFGVLKLIDRSPAADLVTSTIPFHTGGWVVPVLGGVEVVLGLWIAAGIGMRWALPVLFGHLLATFGVLVVVPDRAFQDGNPALLTMEGEFVIKNLVLLAAVLVVTTRTARPHR